MASDADRARCYSIWGDANLWLVLLHHNLCNVCLHWLATGCAKSESKLAKVKVGVCR